jgi:hypothetical protein
MSAIKALKLTAPRVKDEKLQKRLNAQVRK